MHLDDPTLPAATALTTTAADLLGPAVVAAGGTLHRACCVGVHYLPGRELVARYDCDVTWPTGRTRDTLLAATTTNGPLEGTVPVTAETPDATLRAGVWRWPFDPVVVGLPIATTPTALAGHLRPVTGGGAVRVQVVAYRPTERAVVRVTDEQERTFYLKAVPPGQVESMTVRHAAMRRAGVPAPEILQADERNGLLLLEAMPGATLRERIKSGRGAWPRPEALTDLLAAIDSAIAGPMLPPARASRTRDALAHTRLLAATVPDAADELDALRSRLQDSVTAVEQRSGTVIHGDLHEAQLFVDHDGAITGIIDLDDVGPGDPLDDPAVLLGHLEYRALTGEPATAELLRPRIRGLTDRFASIHGGSELELAIAAVLTGLATGPFRSQSPQWRELTATVIGAATRHMANAGRPRAPSAC